jgi:hypothetical protein
LGAAADLGIWMRDSADLAEVELAEGLVGTLSYTGAPFGTLLMLKNAIIDVVVRAHEGWRNQLLYLFLMH